MFVLSDQNHEEALRVTTSTAQRQQARKRKSERRRRRIEHRHARWIEDRSPTNGPSLSMKNMTLDVSERIHAHGAGGLGLVHQMVDRLGLNREIDERLVLFKLRQGYSESDHVLAQAYNVLAGGRCLEDMDRLRNDEALLNNLGARCLPDPTTAGDFCRRFKDKAHVDALSDAINETRLQIWRQQSPEFLEEALIDGDGTIVETYGECKQDISLSYKGTWGYQPLLISLANTAEPIFLLNRTAAANSAQGAAEYYDKAFDLCRRAGFKKITARGDTAFSQTAHLDRWDAGGVTFTFGFPVVPGVQRRIEALPDTEWARLERESGSCNDKSAFRTRPENVKQRIVTERGYKDLRVKSEDVAEFQHEPTRANGRYRVVVLRKEVEAYQGEQRLFTEYRYFAYITNDRSRSAEEVVFLANKRGAQEKLIGGLKSDVRSLRAPIDNLVSNWAYMTMASLAWSLKAWVALLLPRGGRWAEKHNEDRQRILTMGFRGFVEGLIRVPVQVVIAARQVHVRLLAWNPFQRIFLRWAQVVERPAIC